MRILIAGGGTGGHLFPGIALAEEVITRHPKNDVLFVGTNRGIEATVVPREGYKFEPINVTGLKGKGLFTVLAGLFRLPGALWQSMRIVRRWKPDVVVGVGGYASGPAVLAAWMLRIPTAIQEQNALPGMTNKILGRFAQTVFVAFEEARRFFPARKVQLLGNPVRRKLFENYLRPQSPGGKFRLLVFGGSLGARTLNEKMVEAFRHMRDLGGQITVVHQLGAATNLAEVEKAYQEMGVEATVTEFIYDMSSAYAQADLCVCRAGATTLAELTTCKKAAILVPFPYAADNHQERNALALVDKGAAVMIRESELTGESLAQVIRELHADPARRARMERAAGLLGRPEAAKEIADVCAQMCAGGTDR